MCADQNKAIEVDKLSALYDLLQSHYKQLVQRSSLLSSAAPLHDIGGAARNPLAFAEQAENCGSLMLSREFVGELVTAFSDATRVFRAACSEAGTPLLSLSAAAANRRIQSIWGHCAGIPAIDSEVIWENGWFWEPMPERFKVYGPAILCDLVSALSLIVLQLHCTAASSRDHECLLRAEELSAAVFLISEIEDAPDDRIFGEFLDGLANCLEETQSLIRRRGLRFAVDRMSLAVELLRSGELEAALQRNASEP
jgi:hypothetical protein